MIPKINKPTRVTRKTAIAIAALIITKTTALMILISKLQFLKVILVIIF